MGMSEFLFDHDTGLARIDAHGLEVGSRAGQRFRIKPDDPSTAEIQLDWTQHVGRGAWQTRTEIRTTMSATKDAFLISAALDAYEGENRVFTKSWDRAISRDGV
jgi:hypothetical protein